MSAAPQETDLLQEQLVGGSSFWSDAWKRLKKSRQAIVGGAILIIVVVASLVGPFLTPYSQEVQDLERQLEPPSWDHPFGTDLAGRDMLTRVLMGGRLSLAVGMVATLVSLLIGVTWGSVAGFKGGNVDNAMMRVVDMLYSLPFMFFVILLVAFLGRNLLLLFLALGAVQWLTMSRIVRGQMIQLRAQEFVQAAVALGVSNRRIIFRHLIPNMLGPIIVYATLTVPAVMLEEAFLSFLGLGVQPPNSSWGLLAADGAKTITALRTAWWLILFPGLALGLTLFALNFLGDGLRDALDPKLKNQD
ncbi:MAG: ABC transporter permease [Candidatus Eisenbacteria bacterium]|uniref:Oligopeptide transport system permease protein OppC n=1 Tax=Eiseniibacteriota bacterium TaxID=2212470 RepID=A0A7Y2EES6_UNCEI|nr:ABC transporter permease [Candidatus Eisenbacteria bacterium]